jgi:hypothetical protein
MTNEEIARAQEIKEEIRKAINQIIDEEYNSVINKMVENNARLTNRNIDDIVREILSSGN